MRKLSHWQRGQGLPEYAMILGAVALVSIVVLGLVALAVSRQYGLLAAVFGTRKDVHDTLNYVYFDNNPPQCGYVPGDGKRELYMQFFTDIEPYLTATTENGNIPLSITPNGSPTLGEGDWLIEADIPVDLPCPLAVVIQSDPAHGGITVVWNVLQQDW